MPLPQRIPTWFPALALVVALAAFVWASLDRDIRRVQVEGELSPAEQAEVMALVGSAVDGGLLSADIEHMAQKLKDLSWPRWVGVRREWPNTLVVTVEKAAVIARWSEDRYLTSAGEVVQLAAPIEGLPTLICAHAEPLAAMEMFRALAAAAQPARLRIARLQQNLLGEWTVQFDNGVSLSLGATTVADRMNRFIFAYARTLHAHAGTIAHVDARYANGLAVRFSSMIAGNTVDAVRQ